MSNTLQKPSPLLLLVYCLYMIAPLPAQEVPQVRLPEETAGLKNIAKTLVSTFDVVDVLALADTHQRKIDSDLRLAVVRDPEFAQKVHFILVEFANTVDQPTLDRYINGENVPPGDLQQVWRNTCCGGVWDSPVYAEFLAAVRDLNKKLPLDRRIRVLAGDPPAGTPTTQREASAVGVLRSQVLDKGGKALVIYGGGHVGYGFGINGAVLASGRRIFVGWAMGGQDPAYQQLDRKLKLTERPLLFSAAEPPVPNLGVGFQVDAFVYFGSGEDTETRVEPAR